MSKRNRARNGGVHKKAKQAAHAHAKLTRATKFKNALLREDLDSQVHTVYALNKVAEPPSQISTLSEGVSELADAFDGL